MIVGDESLCLCHLVLFPIHCYVVSYSIVIAAGIMVLLAIAISVEIAMNFLGTNLVSSVAPAVCQRYGMVCLRLPRRGFLLSIYWQTIFVSCSWL